MAAGHRSGPCRTRNYLSKVVIIEMRIPARGPEDREKKVRQVGFQPNLPRPGAPGASQGLAVPFIIRARASTDEHYLVL